MNTFDILKDTLIIHELPALGHGLRRKPIKSSKYYFFDTGIVRNLQGRNTLTQGTPEYGLAFETYIMHELIAWRDYKKKWKLNFWKSKSGFEVDFIINNKIAIEVKAKTNITQDDLRSLKAVKSELSLKKNVSAYALNKESVLSRALTSFLLETS